MTLAVYFYPQKAALLFFYIFIFVIGLYYLHCNELDLTGVRPPSSPQGNVNNSSQTQTNQAAAASLEVNESAAGKDTSKILQDSGLKKLTPDNINDPQFQDKLKGAGFTYDEKTGNFKSETGVRLALYQSSDGKVFASFIGYGDNDFIGQFKGWTTDVAQAFGGDPFGQYGSALKVGDILNDKYGKQLIITGQSLGGGLASAAGVTTGARTITFNASGLNPNTLGMSQADLTARSGNITAYDVRGEFVWGLQNNSGGMLPTAAGRQIYLQPVNLAMNSFQLHYPENILPALNNYYMGGGK